VVRIPKYIKVLPLAECQRYSGTAQAAKAQRALSVLISVSRQTDKQIAGLLMLIRVIRG
jgi:hypothetical protein